MEKRALGKGLSALFSDNNLSVTKEKSPDSVAYIKTSEIRENSSQPRLNYNEDRLKELRDSIRDKGVLQPILVREVDGGYEVIAGERRLRAARDLGLDDVPVVIKKANNQEALVLALVENIQREDLNPIEEALAYKKLSEEFHLTQEAVAKTVGKDRSTVTNIIRLLKLPNDIQGLIASGALSVGHARALLAVDGDFDLQELVQKIIQDKLTVRDIELLVKEKSKSRKKKYKNVVAEKNLDILNLEDDLCKILGTKVRLMIKKDCGKIVIEYYRPEDLDRILQVIKKG
jgi:ParB family chromosome partitioning protein